MWRNSVTFNNSPVSGIVASVRQSHRAPVVSRMFSRRRILIWTRRRLIIIFSVHLPPLLRTTGLVFVGLACDSWAPWISFWWQLWISSFWVWRFIGVLSQKSLGAGPSETSSEVSWVLSLSNLWLCFFFASLSFLVGGQGSLLTLLNSSPILLLMHRTRNSPGVTPRLVGLEADFSLRETC